MTPPAIEVRERETDGRQLPMWHLEVLADGQFISRGFWSEDGFGKIIYLDAEHPPGQMLDAGWIMLGYTGSVPVMRPPTT